MSTRAARSAPNVSESRAALRTLEPGPVRSADQFEDDPKFVTALARGFELLRAFQRRVGPLSNKDLAELTGIPKPTVTRITHTLKQLGYLKQRDRDSRFELSLSTLSLGYPLLSGSRIRHVAHDFMTKLAATHDCTVMLAAREGLSMVVVDERCGHSNTTMRVDVGARIEIPRSAIGRAYIAGLPKEAQQELFSELQVAYGKEWAPLRDRVVTALAEYSKRGFVLVESEWRRDTRSVATPVMNGGAVMVLGCGAPTFSVPRQTFEEQIGPHLVHVAGALAKFIDG